MNDPYLPSDTKTYLARGLSRSSDGYATTAAGGDGIYIDSSFNNHHSNNHTHNHTHRWKSHPDNDKAVPIMPEYVDRMYPLHVDSTPISEERHTKWQNLALVVCLIVLMIAAGLLEARKNGSFSSAIKAQASTWQYHQDNSNMTYEIPDECLYNEDMECNFNDFVTVCGCFSYVYTNYGDGWVQALDRNYRFASANNRRRRRNRQLENNDQTMGASAFYVVLSNRGSGAGSSSSGGGGKEKGWTVTEKWKVRDYTTLVRDVSGRSGKWIDDQYANVPAYHETQISGGDAFDREYLATGGKVQPLTLDVTGIGGGDKDDEDVYYLVDMEIKVQCALWGQTSVVTLLWDASEDGLNITYPYDLRSYSSCEEDEEDCEVSTGHASPCSFTNGFGACVVPCLGGATWKAMAIVTGGVVMEHLAVFNER